MNKSINEIQRGDVFYADLSPIKGSEQGGTRPILVIQNNVGNKFSTTVIVAPITSRIKKRELPTHVQLPANIGLPENSLVLLEQVRTIDKCRVDQYITSIDDYSMTQVDRALGISLGLKTQQEEHKERPDRLERPDEMVLCLCPTCASQFFNSPNHIIRRVNPLSEVKEDCTYCQVRKGYDYRIIHARKKLGSDLA